MHHKEKNPHHHHETIIPAHATTKSPAPLAEPTLALVIKGDSDGCERAICDLLTHPTKEGVPVEIIHKGVGDICKTDVMSASTGSRLVLGFNVEVLPRLAELCHELNVEVRIYSVIYKLHEDVQAIARSLLPRTEQEIVLGRAKVIALFKSSRKGIILGCEVEQGRVQLGDSFRLITAMGPVYSGKVLSLHIAKDAVSKATPGQQVGVKIDDFNRARIGDFLECYQLLAEKNTPTWRPSGKILHI